MLYTGRTIRAGLDALLDHGRPARVQLLVLIDRGHGELPIEARYVGRSVQMSGIEIIEVKFSEIDDSGRGVMSQTWPIVAGSALHGTTGKPHHSVGDTSGLRKKPSSRL